MEYERRNMEILQHLYTCGSGVRLCTNTRSFIGTHLRDPPSWRHGTIANRSIIIILVEIPRAELEMAGGDPSRSVLTLTLRRLTVPTKPHSTTSMSVYHDCRPCHSL